MSTAAGLDKIFRPQTIAVIGATSRPGSIGRELTHNLISYDFKGQVFPINPNAKFIHSIKCYPSILDVPDPVDLAIIMVRRDLVLPTLEACGIRGVGGAVVITAGFKETGPEGAARELELVKCAAKYNIRMIGPNCFGVINTHPDVMLNATFSRTAPLPGRIGFMSQSGALGEAILGHARRLGIGFSMFASVGNKADISGNTLLEYWQDDPDTQIILLYLESFGDPEAFTRVARQITRTKPIIAVKSGRTVAGARATISHTGALAGEDIGADALFDQCGVLRVNSMEELFDLAEALDRQPTPKGNRVAILTNAGGPGILATDAAVGVGLDIVRLDPETTATLKAHLPAEAATGNPVDMIASASPDNYRMALRALFADPNVDAIICIFVPPIMIDEMAVADAIVEASAGAKKAILSCFMGAGGGTEGPERLKAAGIPVFTFPEQIAQVLKMMGKYHDWQSRPARVMGPAPECVAKVRARLKSLADEGHRQILGGEALEVLACCGIPTARLVRARDHDHARQIAAEIGYPVVLKLDAESLAHKTEIGGVVTDVRNAEELGRHYDTLLHRAARNNLADPGILIQPMVKGGIEMAIGMMRDPQFGPMVMCGIGGVLIEVVRDIVFKLPPVTPEDAREMLASLRGSKLLSGYRGAPPVDTEPLVETLVTVSHLVSDFPLIRELDINPFMACPAGEGGA
ncbi:MAG TPA: acetate--CoA ligase family protein, partial [Acidobacteriota bacterium]|nr:acetate--CoA ligase family protein [Acidobacteriota bacterium]